MHGMCAYVRYQSFSTQRIVHPYTEHALEPARDTCQRCVFADVTWIMLTS